MRAASGKVRDQDFARSIELATEYSCQGPGNFGRFGRSRPPEMHSSVTGRIGCCLGMIVGIGLQGPSNVVFCRASAYPLAAGEVTAIPEMRGSKGYAICMSDSMPVRGLMR